ncbi:MAG TPA: peptidylprolyl isomerase [Burkholderiales bacterium]|nr:peptidylprolyl isomerase [Burkholderiales bacterium]
MNVAPGTVVSLAVRLFDLQGELLDEPEQPAQYLHGGYGDIFPKVEAALEGKPVGAKVQVNLEPEDGFGDYDEQLLRVEDRGRFPETLEVGMRFEGESDDDEGVIYTVTDIAEGKVVLDGNHPLAGIGLRFDCEVVDIRPANESELANGSADDPDSVIVRPLP